MTSLFWEVATAKTPTFIITESVCVIDAQEIQGELGITVLKMVYVCRCIILNQPNLTIKSLKYVVQIMVNKVNCVII